VTTRIVQIQKPLKPSQKDVSDERLDQLDLPPVQAGTAYKKLFDLEPQAEPEKPLKINFNLYQLES
jgi:hypothetical protein